VIPSFCKRGDIIVADRSVNFAIQKGIQISRSTVRWYDHGDYQGLERVLESIRKDDKKYKRNPTASRRFIITEGVFENDGSMVNLPKVVRGCRPFPPRSRAATSR
jgi:serine palmitoyltransferase